MRATTTTTSSEVREDYYGIPPIKAPHWRWLVISYIFIGGLAGGSFVIATLADLLGRDTALVRAGRYLSLAGGAVSPVLLALDLGRPDRALHMFRIVKLRSPMSLGSWALLGLGLVAAPVSLLQLLADLTGRERFGTARRVLSVVGLLPALFVAGYTGVLLAATNVPLWARNYLLWGPTFIASAFSTSLAALSLLLHLGGSGSGNGDERGATLAALRRAETISLLTELSLILAGLVRLGGLGEPLTGGRWGRVFWPVTLGAGLLAPLGLHVRAARRAEGQAGRRAAVLSSVLALLGGFTLRMVVVLAGKESAETPRYYFAYTRNPDGTHGGREERRV